MASHIGRRKFLAALGGAAATWPVAARAQQPAMPVAGILGISAPDTIGDRLQAFRLGLKEAGYIDGENLAIDYRWTENQFDRFPELAADFVRKRVAVRGPQVFPALLAGEAQVYFGPLLSSIAYIRAGNLRPLAVTTTTRSPVLPDIPALSETLPGYEGSAWFGMGAPKNTPVEIIERLNTEVNASIADPKFQARLANLGGAVLAGSPADFGKLISDETKKWGKVIVAANIKPQ